MKYKWIIKESKGVTKDFLEIALNLEIVAKLLLNRGINSTDKAKAYLDSNFYLESKPEDIPDLLRARDRIIEAINKGEKIVIFGDYDVDGVTATSCLLLTIKQFTDKVDFYIPSRLNEGYGLNVEAVKVIAKEYKAKLLITCDCGITNHKEIDLAKELGMDVIVTDHHALPETLVPAYAVLNPKLLPVDHKLHFLPGVGIAYKLAEAILAEQHIIARSVATKQSPDDSRNKIASSGSALLAMTKEDLLDLVTLGMIADLVPLVGENRYLVQIGLPELANTQKIGLQELLRICGLMNKNKDNPTTDHVGFGIAPRINAIGRLADAALAVRLLTTDDLSEAIQIACELDTQNRQRQSLCEEILNDALVLVSEHVDLQNDKCIVLAKENWHPGVLGIVASRLVEKFHLPTILIGIDKEQNIARGSGRSIEQLNIVEVLSRTSEHLDKFGGHKAACGLSIKPENIESFIFDFKNTVNNLLSSSDLEPILQVDLELPLSDLNIELVNKISMLAPFGIGNPVPLFVSEEAEILDIKKIGKGGQHLKLLVKAEQVYEALIWNYESKHNDVRFSLKDKVKFVYTPKLNSYNGEVFLQLEIKDWHLLDRAVVPAYLHIEEKEKPKTLVELYDYRGKTEECLKLFSSRDVVYFAEVEQKDYLPLQTHSRSRITEKENLVFLETPPDEHTFCEIVASSKAKEVYLAFATTSEPSNLSLGPQNLLKRLVGLLKYVKGNKSSRVAEVELQSALGLNKVSLAYALEVLTKIGFLQYRKATEGLSINILTPSRQNLSELIEYNLLVSEIKKILQFSHWLSKTPLSEVAKVLNDRKDLAVLVAAQDVKALRK